MKKTTMSTLVLALSSALAIGASVKVYADNTMPSSSTTAPDTKRTSGQFVDDATITTKVKSSFAADSTVSALHINVDTHKGVVTLSGNVASQAEKDQAIALAKGVADVKSVNSKLTIKSASSAK